jgi:hypothetical protein
MLLRDGEAPLVEIDTAPSPLMTPAHVVVM